MSLRLDGPCMEFTAGKAWSSRKKQKFGITPREVMNRIDGPCIEYDDGTREEYK